MAILVNMVAESDILDRVPGLLQELAGLPVERADRVEWADLILNVGPHVFAVEAKSDSRAGPVSQAAQSALAAAKRVGARAVPLVAVPFMGEVGRGICNRAGVSFVDLSGNADIKARGLRVSVIGRPNRFLQRGRPPSVFAPKSSRISRLFLLDPKRWWRQSELSVKANLDPGYVSKICRRMDDDHLIERDADVAVRPRDPNLLLEAWREEYDFGRHSIREGHVTARTGEELVRRLVDACRETDCSYTLTGLASAWLLAPFAGYRLVTVYINKPPSNELLSNLKWYEEKRGANLWLVRPNDEGVLYGGESVNGISCVSPVQAYLDLKGMPERSDEAAEQLRKESLHWQ